MTEEMKLSEIKENWVFTKNLGATSYWFEETHDGTGKTIGPKDVLEIGCKLEAELEERTHQYHLAHAKILSREAIIEQLSESELAKDVIRLEAENERLEHKIEFRDKEIAALLRKIDELDALKKGE